MSSTIPTGRFLPEPPVAPAEPPASWSSCPTCWGQRRILEPAADGEGLVPVVCPACIGIGERPGPPAPVS